MSYIITFLYVVSSLVTTGLCLNCTHCTNNSAPFCDGPTQTCKAESGKDTFSFVRSCGSPDQCLKYDSMTSYSMSTALNRTCCKNDSCTPAVPFLPNKTTQINNIHCNACFAHDITHCSVFTPLNCTGEETNCDKYHVQSEAGSTYIWGCSSNNFCKYLKSQKTVDGTNFTVTARCDTSQLDSSSPDRVSIIPYLMVFLLAQLI